MKHFVIYRKLILIIGTATAVVSVGVFFFMEDILFRTLFISFAFVFFGGLLFLLDFLHNRYNDNLLEEITLLIEAWDILLYHIRRSRKRKFRYTHSLQGMILLQAVSMSQKFMRRSSQKGWNRKKGCR